MAITNYRNDLLIFSANPGAFDMLILLRRADHACVMEAAGGVDERLDPQQRTNIFLNPGTTDIGRSSEPSC